MRLIVFSDIDFVPQFLLLASLDIDKEANKVLWVLLYLLSHEHAVVVECFVHHESPDVILVIVCQAELYLSFPVRFVHLHVLFLLLCIFNFYRLEVSDLSLDHFFLCFLFFLIFLAEKLIFLLKKLVNFLFKISFLSLVLAGIDIPGELFLTLIDRIHLTQAFFNLLVNVIKFIYIDDGDHWDSLLENLIKHFSLS